ncbi:hypothetical protein [Pseudaminobacter salicylatoxidans]|uniref:hypothetical protein n=1 Tax=Pseudaminobacter salicylatoxidans TaxID=93369 RepID=UPI000A04D292|nr:hypothetical protein [Pseudaminobacter salicylatoxidans]
MTKLHQFVGDDRAPRRKQPPTADTLFRLGHDTMQIAEILGCTEAEALKLLSASRSARLGLDHPYETSPRRRTVCVWPKVTA